MTLRLTHRIYDALRARGEEAYPEECCGALLGRATDDGWEIVAAVGAKNASTAAGKHYEIAAAELVRIARQARALGVEIGGFYHSHPDTVAEWSTTDLEEAHWIGASYVITEVVRGKAVETRSFRLAGKCEEDKRFVEERIELDEDDSVHSLED